MKQPKKPASPPANELAKPMPQTPRERRQAQRDEFNKRFESYKRGRKS